MHIALVSPEFPPETNWGGIASFNFNLVNHLQEFGYTITIFAQGKNNSFVNNSKVHYQSIEFKSSNKLINFLYYNIFSKLLRNSVKLFFPLTSQILKWNLFATLEICEYLKKNKKTINLFYTTDYRSPGLVLKIVFRKTKWIQYLHGPQLLFANYATKNIDKKIQQYIELFDLKYFSKHVQKNSHSKQIISLMKKYKVQVNYVKPLLPFYNHLTVKSNNKIFVKKSSIDLNKLVYYGRIEHRKGVDLLLKVFLNLVKTFPKLELHIIGDDSNDFGPDKNLPLTNYIKSTSKNIFFCPYISHRNSLNTLLTALNGIVVVPSRFEPLGYTIIESMFCESIVLTTSNEEDLIKDNENGFSCAANQKALLKKLSEIKKMNHNQLIKIKRQARESLIARYSLKQSLQPFIKIS